jgi:hypothetical protein
LPRRREQSSGTSPHALTGQVRFDFAGVHAMQVADCAARCASSAAVAAKATLPKPRERW